MNKRPDDSDDEGEGFRMSNSGRKKFGNFPEFASEIASNKEMVRALFSVPRSRAPDEPPDDARKAAIAELVRTKRAKPAETRLPPLPMARAQRERCEQKIAAGMTLRVANSRPDMHQANHRRAVHLARKQRRCEAEQPKNKTWQTRLPPRSASCPPDVLPDGSRISDKYRATPWEDPAVRAYAEKVERAARRKPAAKRDDGGTSPGGPAFTGSAADERSKEKALLEAKARYVIPVNDDVAEAASPMPSVLPSIGRSKTSMR